MAASPTNWTWLVAGIYDRHPDDFAPEPTIFVDYNPRVHFKGPSHIRISFDNGSRAIFALKGRGTQADGQTWDWDGDLDSPTIFQTFAPEWAGAGWKGKLIKGDFRTVG